MTEAGKTAKSTLWSHHDTLCTPSDEFVAEGIRVRLMGATLELSFEASSPHSPGAAKSLAEKYVKALEDCLGLSLVLMTEEEWVARTTPPLGPMRALRHTEEDRTRVARALRKVRNALLASTDKALR
jgi:hypothetical protein